MLQTFYIDTLCTFFFDYEVRPLYCFFYRRNVMHMLFYTAAHKDMNRPHTSMYVQYEHLQ